MKRLKQIKIKFLLALHFSNYIFFLIVQYYVMFVLICVTKKKSINQIKIVTKKHKFTTALFRDRVQIFFLHLLVPRCIVEKILTSHFV